MTEIDEKEYISLRLIISELRNQYVSDSSCCSLSIWGESFWPCSSLCTHLVLGRSHLLLLCLGFPDKSQTLPLYQLGCRCLQLNLYRSLAQVLLWEPLVPNSSCSKSTSWGL